MSPRAYGGVLALLGVTAFAGLAVWQWQRATWKERLLAAHAEAMAAPARPWAVATAAGTPPLAADLPADALRAEPALPMRVALSGRYVAGSTLVLDNQRVDGRVGAMVLDLLEPTDGGPAVYVNRGFIAYPGNRRVLSPIAPVRGEVRVEGLLVPPPATGLRLGAFGWRPGDLSPQPWIDVEAAAAQLGRRCLRAVILLDPDPPGGFIRRWQALPNTLPPEQHRGYAFQWLALALAVAATYLILALRRR